MMKLRNSQRLLLLFLVVGVCQIHFTDSAFAKKKYQNTPYQEYLYQQKILKKLEKEKYEQSLLPFSGYMSKDEYEDLSKNVETSKKDIPEPKLPNDIKMKYIPQPTFKLARYNNPPGTAELGLARRFQFDRQINGEGITSPDRSVMVYPAVYYYANSQCTAADLFVIPLDKTLPDVERILRANVVKREPNPLLSTDKSVVEKFTFRTMTPVDFSPDGLRLAAKEKIGNTYDGIWKTNLWVYDFETKTAKNLSEVRDAIKFYWMNTKGTMLDDKRWDIYPMGFDSNDPTRVIVTAYGYTGKTPVFLGTWSIDYKGEQTQLISLFDSTANVSINGFKLVQDGVVNPIVIKNEEKKLDKTIKKKRKTEKKAQKANRKKGKQELDKKLKEMQKETNQSKSLYKKQNRVSKPTGVD